MCTSRRRGARGSISSNAGSRRSRRNSCAVVCTAAPACWRPPSVGTSRSPTLAPRRWCGRRPRMRSWRVGHAFVIGSLTQDTRARPSNSSSNKLASWSNPLGATKGSGPGAGRQQPAERAVAGERVAAGPGDEHGRAVEVIHEECPQRHTLVLRSGCGIGCWGGRCPSLAAARWSRRSSRAPSR